MGNDTEPCEVIRKDGSEEVYAQRILDASDEQIAVCALLAAPMFAADGKWGVANLIEQLGQRLREANKRLEGRGEDDAKD